MNNFQLYSFEKYDIGFDNQVSELFSQIQAKKVYKNTLLEKIDKDEEKVRSAIRDKVRDLTTRTPKTKFQILQRQSNASEET